MILTNRRLRLLYLSLAAMDMAVLLPWLTNLVTYWARNGNAHALRLEAMLTQSPILLFVIFWATMIFYMLLTDLLGEWDVTGALHPIAVLSALTITSLLAVRFLLYPEMAPGDFSWLREIIYSIVNLLSGVRGELLLLITNYVLWMRVAYYTDRSITFFSVGFSFRLGMLLVVFGCALLAAWSDSNDTALLYMVLFFAFGLCAVALARIDQKAVGTANSSGALLPWDRFAQLWLVIVAILGAALGAATFYTPPILRTVLGWFSPLGTLIQWLFTGMTYLVFLLLTPLLEWLRDRMQEAMAGAESAPMDENLPLPQTASLGEIVQEFALLRYCIAATLLFIALVILVIFYARVVRRVRKSEDEDASTEGGLRPGGFSLGLDRLKDWFALLGRYGVSSQLLAAISVENIYANLSRIARRKGFPRHPSQGPDRYLPLLIQAFEGHDAELNAITAAYIRVRYAERPITSTELETLRAAYNSITAPPDKPTGPEKPPDTAT